MSIRQTPLMASWLLGRCLVLYSINPWLIERLDSRFYKEPSGPSRKLTFEHTYAM